MALVDNGTHLDLYTWQVALAVQGDRAVVVYSSLHDSQFHTSDSGDATTWENLPDMPKAGSIAALTTYNDQVVML